MSEKTVFYRVATPPGYVFSWHTAACYLRTRKAVAARAAWIKKYPNFCRECNGAGVQTWVENQSPIGSGMYWPMEMAEPCSCAAPDDIEDMVCPRCGEKLYRALIVKHSPQEETLWLKDEYGQDGIIESWLEEAGPCPLCGWNWGNGKDDVRPFAERLCGCYTERQLPAQAARPRGLQAMMFKLFGQVGQVFFKYPVVILESEREYNKYERSIKKGEYE